MLKKFVVVALVLLFVGVVFFVWVSGEKRKEQQQIARYKLKYASETQEYLKQYNQWLQLPSEERGALPWGLDKDGKAKSEAQLLAEQQERLKADLDKLAAGETQIYPFTDLLYGPGWQEKLGKYKSQKEFREFILSTSILCTSAGGIIFTWCLLLLTARLLVKGSFRLRTLLVNFISRQRKIEKRQSLKPPAQQDREDSTRQQKLNERCAHLAKHSKVLISSGWRSPGETRPANPKAQAAQLNSRQQNICSAALMVPPAGAEPSAAPQESSMNIVDDLLKAQTEHLEKQVTELRQMAQTVQQTALEHSKPLENGLRELAEQISAIRDYAAQQQNRMEKLQDGYDWSIIRIFCLRVIRCIDNLENRIAQLSQQNLETTQLEEVKDELIFALESSGVEQFQPQLYSEYGGQEKKAEAVKDKSPTFRGDPNMSGKIAEIIRPGYQYVVDEQNVKVVRMAQVRLFE